MSNTVSQDEARKKDFYVVRNAKTGDVLSVVFPNGIRVGLNSTGFNQGITLSNTNTDPVNTKNALYAKCGRVYFDGSLVASSTNTNVAIKDEGIILTLSASSINFVGSSVTATAIGNDVTVTVSSSIPGGADTQVQFNDGGSTFNGDSGLSYNKTTKSLTVTGDVYTTGASFIIGMQIFS